MSSPTLKHSFTKGILDATPFLLVIIPFGLLFGVVATEAGFNILETMSMTALVIAGASQFTAVQLLSEHAPTFVVILSALAVNMRMAMYSASIQPHLGKAPMWQRIFIAYFLVDQTYACAIQAYEKHPNWSMQHKVAYFAGTVVPICLPWYIATYTGIIIGSTIPPEYALDFAVPITFIAIFSVYLRSLPHFCAALVSIITAILCAWMPYSSGLFVAAAFAMGTGALVEILLERRIS